MIDLKTSSFSIKERAVSKAKMKFLSITKNPKKKIKFNLIYQVMKRNYL